MRRNPSLFVTANEKQGKQGGHLSPEEQRDISQGAFQKPRGRRGCGTMSVHWLMDLSLAYLRFEESSHRSPVRWRKKTGR